ncbi:allantoate amidohydrolase [soil metagenome]
MSEDFASRAALWLDELGAITDEPGELTRTFLSPAQARAKALVSVWLQEAGLEVYEDLAGNLIGRLASSNPTARTLACGSHIDTVRNAGQYDGAVGIVTAALAAGALKGQELPYHLEVVAFSDEEGVRFQSTYLGSKYYAGKLTGAELAVKDVDGMSVQEAMAAHRPTFPLPPPRELLAYVEAHIEQGPVLEKEELALGVVTAIAGQTRAKIFIEGKAGHAGTTPMNMRRDALTGAAECVLTIEQYATAMPALVATVGELRIASPASNVIPGSVEFTLDVRDADEEVRRHFCSRIVSELQTQMGERGLGIRIEILQENPPVNCSSPLTEALESLVLRRQETCPRLVSGAGHDAAALAEVAEVAMLFIRCRDGLSHHPDEYATSADIGLAAQILAEFFSQLQPA